MGKAKRVDKSAKAAAAAVDVDVGEPAAQSVLGNGNESGVKPRHLLVLVHGLFGKDEHMKNIATTIIENFEGDCNILVHVSGVNGGVKSLHGIDTCGERLLEELHEFTARHPSLETISLLSHSLGGLIARYVIGQAFDNRDGTILGLVPLHFITVCTPHLGCNDKYENLKKQDAVTPCLRWMGLIPVLGRLAACLFTIFEPPVVTMCLRRTGDQLFLRDGDRPLVEQMAMYPSRKRQPPENGADEGEGVAAPTERVVDYLEALAAFKERTCYGNIQYDHVVAWENATVRRKCELPKELYHNKGVPYGIVNEEVEPPRPRESEEEQSTCALREKMIRNLEMLGWRRVDVKTKILIHKGAPFTHDNVISKKDIHDNFRTVAMHSSDLIINSTRKYDA